MLSKVEKTRREIFSVGNLKIYNEVNYSNKGKDDQKLDFMYESSYDSEKYSNAPELSNIFIRTSNYLVFSYRDIVDGKFNGTEEVYISFPTIEILRNFLSETLNDLIENEKVYYTKSGITEEGNEKIYESEPFAQGKTLAVVPFKIERESLKSELPLMYNGIALFIDDENYFVEMDLGTFATLVEIINSDFSLMRDSAITNLMAMVYELHKMVASLMNGGFGSSGSSSRLGGKTSNMSRRPSMNKPKFKKPSSFNKNKQPTIDEMVEDDEDEIEDSIEDAEEEKKTSMKGRKPAGKKVVHKKATSKKQMTLKDLDADMNSDDDEDDPIVSLKDVMDMAQDESELDDLELDED